jgi:hypothetical protein
VVDARLFICVRLPRKSSSLVGPIMTSNNAAIEYQDPLGNWITVVTAPNQPPLILNGMKSVGVLCPGKRVRAVDQDGKLIDIL